MMNYLEISAKAVHWMNARGWRTAYGKKGAFTQSLLQHTEIELNVLMALLPIFARPEHYGLTELEQQALIVGQIAHDVGKETNKWQLYVRAPRDQQRGNYVPHVIRPLTDEAVADLVETLGFPASIIMDATKFVNLHMASTRNTTNVLLATLSHQGDSKRWNTLARIVDTIDNICSIPGLLPTLEAIEKDRRAGGIGPHIELAYHQINLRGVSSVLLHKAAERAHTGKGWAPLLFFSDGTIYVADGLAGPAQPTPDEISALFAQEIENALPKSGFAKRVVGSPTANFLPKPEFFDYREIETYLLQASKRIGRGSFRKKPAIKRRDVVQKISALKGLSLSLSDQQIDTESERVDSAQPEMLVFKFFKAAVDAEIVGKSGAFTSSETYSKLEDQLATPDISEKDQKRVIKAMKKIADEGAINWNITIDDEYKKIFGDAALAQLQSTSTLMPVPELVNVIEPFWNLPGHLFDLPHPLIGDAPDDVRMAALIRALGDIAKKAYLALPEDLRPIRATAEEIGRTFVDDLIHPSQIQPEQMAELQMRAYELSKPQTMKSGDSDHLCPICNQPFTKGTVASADFLEKPESHTNRAVAHGRTGSVMICNACKYERFLQQLLLGEKVGRVLVITPRNHIGRWTGAELVRKVEAFREDAAHLMSNSTTNPNEQMTLALTSLIARKLFAESAEFGGVDQLANEGLSGNELSRMLSYKVGDEKQKEHRKQLGKLLIEEYAPEGEDVARLNEALQTTFATWDDALNAIIQGDIRDDILDDIRAKVYRLQPQLSVVCQTPNFALVPLRYGFAVNDDSAANAALRELFTTLLIGLSLDCSVAAIQSGDAITFVGGEGVARVPPVSAIRELVGADWVGLDEARLWLEKIGAASLLAGDTSYPERSNLYQILCALTPGHILRRIEMGSDSGEAKSKHYELIRKATQVL